MTKAQEVKDFVVTYSDFIDLEFAPPSGCKWYIRLATGDYLFIKLNKNKRMEAQKHIDENFGKGKYRVSSYN
jgi:hypothetical protein